MVTILKRLKNRKMLLSKLQYAVFIYWKTWNGSFAGIWNLNKVKNKLLDRKRFYSLTSLTYFDLNSLKA